MKSYEYSLIVLLTITTVVIANFDERYYLGGGKQYSNWQKNYNDPYSSFESPENLDGQLQGFIPILNHNVPFQKLFNSKLSSFLPRTRPPVMKRNVIHAPQIKYPLPIHPLIPQNFVYFHPNTEMQKENYPDLHASGSNRNIQTVSTDGKPYYLNSFEDSLANSISRSDLMMQKNLIDPYRNSKQHITNYKGEQLDPNWKVKSLLSEQENSYVGTDEPLFHKPTLNIQGLDPDNSLESFEGSMEAMKPILLSQDFMHYKK